MKTKSAAILIMGSLLLFSSLAFAQDVVENSGPGQINWTKQEVVFTGDGAPNLKAPNAAAARLGAERAAKLMALRNALEVLKGVKIKAGQTVGDKLSTDPKLMSEVEGVVKNFSVVDIRYYSDGGVQVDVKVPLKGIIAKTLLKEELAKPKKTAPAAPANTVVAHTGVVIEAKGQKLIPVMSPKIVDEQGNEVYGVSMVSEEGIENGIASYIKDSDLAKKDTKVASNPIVVKAMKSVNNVDIMISNADAEKIRKTTGGVLSKGKVIIVKD